MASIKVIPSNKLPRMSPINNYLVSQSRDGVANGTTQAW